jgi:hypothetical protein
VEQTLTAVALENPASTPAPSDTPSLAFTTTSSATFTPTMTVTPNVPMVTVSSETNCRSGPGQVYDKLGVLNPGETTEVVGRTTVENYWLVRNPDNPVQVCWLWGQYATVTGDWQSLPQATQPPTPTPALAFTFSYDFFGVGPGYQCMMFDVTNTGAITWESYTLSLVDTTHGDTGTTSGNEFITYDNWCGSAVTLLDLTPGEKGTAAVIMHMVHNPSGDHFDATLTLCTGNGLTGTCLTQSISFIF